MIEAPTPNPCTPAQPAQRRDKRKTGTLNNPHLGEFSPDRTRKSHTQTVIIVSAERS